MNFNYQTESIETDALKMEFFLVPWDTEILDQQVAEIKRIVVSEKKKACIGYKLFVDWCTRNNVSFISSRVSHDQVVESMFLQAQGFRFIELNYHPQLDDLQSRKILNDEIVVELATETDRSLLADIAGTVFLHGRFHHDPRLGAEIGNLRYRTWLLNAFDLEHQHVYVFKIHEEIVAFFVVEYPDDTSAFWSLTALAPGMQGMGLGKRVWNSMMLMHQKEGINTITTSISSHNTAVLNLYVSLNFKFLHPLVTYHWRSKDT